MRWILVQFENVEKKKISCRTPSLWLLCACWRLSSMVTYQWGHELSVMTGTNKKKTTTTTDRPKILIFPLDGKQTIFFRPYFVHILGIIQGWATYGTQAACSLHTILVWPARPAEEKNSGALLYVGQYHLHVNTPLDHPFCCKSLLHLMTQFFIPYSSHPKTPFFQNWNVRFQILGRISKILAMPIFS